MQIRVRLAFFFVELVMVISVSVKSLPQPHHLFIHNVHYYIVD